MKTTSSACAAITLPELLITLLIIVVLVSLLFPRQSHRGDQSLLTRATNDGKQLALLANMMANDGASTGDPSLGWPGDLLNATGRNSADENNAITNLDGYLQRMIRHEYVKPGDLAKLMGLAGRLGTVPIWSGQGSFQTRNSIWKVFKTSGDDLGDTLFLSSKNYTYDTSSLDPTQPLGNLGFVVVRKDTSASCVDKPATKDFRQIGLLPGSRDRAHPGTEQGHLLE